MMPDIPTPPDSLPQYLVDPLDRQDVATLRDTKEYIDALIEYRERPIDEAELPEAAEPVDQVDRGKGTIVKERVKCGDESCACMNGGEKHGPYLYRCYRKDGSLTSEYVGKP